MVKPNKDTLHAVVEARKAFVAFAQALDIAAYKVVNDGCSKECTRALLHAETCVDIEEMLNHLESLYYNVLNDVVCD